MKYYAFFGYTWQINEAFNVTNWWNECTSSFFLAANNFRMCGPGVDYVGICNQSW